VKQPLNKLFGKILRIDIEANFRTGGPGAVPHDNPFVNTKNANGLIWVNGMRNPWRCSFDRETYLMYCGDVGQDTYEEVDIITKGANYGWSRFEANSLFNARHTLQGSQTVTWPIISYTHREMSGWGAVTGGYVVRTSRDPRLRAKYLFADLSGPVLLAEESPPSSGQWTFGHVSLQCSASSPLPCQGDGPGSIYSFGEMLSGDILIADDSGSLYRVIEPSKCGL
jgi:hypothetical protein